MVGVEEELLRLAKQPSLLLHKIQTAVLEPHLLYLGHQLLTLEGAAVEALHYPLERGELVAGEMQEIHLLLAQPILAVVVAGEIKRLQPELPVQQVAPA
jgi:hypothetical protein